MSSTLVTGAGGQIGSELVAMLRAETNAGSVVVLDRTACPASDGPTETVDVRDRTALARIVSAYAVDTMIARARIARASLTALDLLQDGDDRRTRLWRNARYFRREMIDRGFTLKSGPHPIVPIMVYDAQTSARMAEALLDRGLYVISFSHPVVPKGEARLRVQLSAAHSPDQINRAVDAFTDVARQHDLLP